MNTSLDLDINNYNLQDILHLFKIPMNFTDVDMKKAKMIVLKTHPDKSGLDSDIFRFYSKAYKVLYSIWEFRKKGDVSNNEKNIEYTVYDDNEKRQLLDGLFENKDEFKSKKHFNTWFNKEFEKKKIHNNETDTGYDNWLRSNEMSKYNAGNVTMENMGQEFEKIKSQARSLIVYQEVEDIYGANTLSASELTNEAPTSYTSSLFSSLAFQDLKQAHTETVIPVTSDDYEQKVKFNNVNEMLSYRDQQNIIPLSEQQALQYLKNREKNDEEKSIRRAFDLAKQTELAQQRNQEFWASLQLLKDGK
jgi:hypothetical protein